MIPFTISIYKNSEAITYSSEFILFTIHQSKIATHLLFPRPKNPKSLYPEPISPDKPYTDCIFQLLNTTTDLDRRIVINVRTAQNDYLCKKLKERPRNSSANMPVASPLKYRCRNIFTARVHRVSLPGTRFTAPPWIDPAPIR